jgi:hypothetical protein
MKGSTFVSTRSIAVLAGMLAWSCTDAGSTVFFESGPCKKDAEAGQAAMPSPLLTPWSGDELMGLTCIAWAPGEGGGEVGIDLLNFHATCGAEWAGEGNADDASVELRVYNTREGALPPCGWCIHDWSFGLQDVEDAASVSLSIEVDIHPGEGDPTVYGADLPGPLSTPGITCRWTHLQSLGEQAAETGTCGDLHMPCGAGGVCYELEMSQCNADLECSDRGDGEQACLAPCAEDTDCAPAGLMTCEEDGLCRLAESW